MSGQRTNARCKYGRPTGAIKSKRAATREVTARLRERRAAQCTVTGISKVETDLVPADVTVTVRLAPPAAAAVTDTGQ